MRTSILIILSFALGFTSCKKTEDKASAWDNKRAEIEAIALHYSAINPYGPGDWRVLQSFLTDDEVVKRFDVDLYRQCLDANITLSREKEELMKEVGCKTLYDKLFYSTPDDNLAAFREENAAALKMCDSLQSSFNSRREKAMAPCVELTKKLKP